LGVAGIAAATASWLGYLNLDSVAVQWQSLSGRLSDALVHREVTSTKTPPQGSAIKRDGAQLVENVMKLFRRENSVKSPVEAPANSGTWAVIAESAVEMERPQSWPGVPLTTHSTEPINTTTMLPVPQVPNDALVGDITGQTVIPLARPKWTPQQAIDPATHADMLLRIAIEAPHLRPQVARNPAAGGELIEWLTELDDVDVNLALASRSPNK
jgi:hypothetical protein